MHGFTMCMTHDAATEGLVYLTVVIVCNCHILWGGVIFATAWIFSHLLDLFRRLAMQEEYVIEAE